MIEAHSAGARWWVLAAATVGLTVAAFLLPWHAASAITGLTWAGPQDLAGSVGHAFAADWASAVPAPGDMASSALTDATRFWRWFHIAKALLALAALVPAVVLVARARRARRAASTTARRSAWAAVTVLGSLVAALSVVLVVANVQGAFAPLSSVLSFLPSSARSPALVDAVTALDASIRSGHPTSTAAAIVRDFAAYHAVVAVLLALLTVVAAVAAVRVVRARRWGSAVVLVATVGVVAVLTAANTGTALAPAPALQSFLSSVT
ncbi:MAG: hypothetical protein U0R68_00915 [Candidatus Nanopelagicales bacterium]